MADHSSALEQVADFLSRRGVSAPAGFWERVAGAYRTPPRHYHGLDHLCELCDRYVEIEAGPGWQQPREVLLAIVFHDAVYVAGRSDNERRSAEMARDLITRFIPEAAIDVAFVTQLIRRTAGHGEESAVGLDDDTGHFLDADMAILAAAGERFAEYDRQIAREYSHLPGPIFRRGRRAFFERLLASEHIFHTPWFRDRHESRARANLQRALGRGPASEAAPAATE